MSLSSRLFFLFKNLILKKFFEKTFRVMLMLLFIFIIVMPLIKSDTVNTFNDAATEKNLTWNIGMTSQTAYIQIPKASQVSSANLTIKGSPLKKPENRGRIELLGFGDSCFAGFCSLARFEVWKECS